MKVYIGAVTKGNSMEVSQEIKNRTKVSSSDSTSGYLSPNIKH